MCVVSKLLIKLKIVVVFFFLNLGSNTSFESDALYFVFVEWDLCFSWQKQLTVTKHLLYTIQLICSII